MSFWLQDLRCDIIGSSADSSSFLSGEAYFGSETKITHFDVHILIKEEISKFKISMNDFFMVEIIQGFEYL